MPFSLLVGDYQTTRYHFS